MKLGWIYYAYGTEIEHYTTLELCAEEQGIELAIANTLTEFLEKYQPFEKYDGILLHPNKKQWVSTIKMMQETLPNKKFAFVLWDSNFYDAKELDDLIFFHPEDILGIKRYFSNNPR